MATKDQDEPFVTNSTTPPSDSMSTSATPADMTPVTRSSDGGGQRSQKTTEVREASFVERTSDFVSETRAEMRRVSWPDATQVKNTTIITIIAVLFFAAYLFVVDRGFTLIIEGLTNLLSRVV